MPINLFTPNMPASGQSLGFTRPLVLGNFANYKENMEQNHEDVNSADSGKHKFITLTDRGSVTPATGATEAGIYATQVNGRMVTFIQRESSTAEVGTTMYPFSSAGPFVAFITVIDLASLVDTNHPNFWGLVEARDVSGAVVNAAAFIKAYTGSLSPLPICTIIFQSSAGANPAVFQISSTNLQIQVTPNPFANHAPINFTITPFYFPES